MTGSQIVKVHGTPEISGAFYSTAIGNFILDKEDSAKVLKAMNNPGVEFCIVPLSVNRERKETDKNGYIWSYTVSHRLTELKSGTFFINPLDAWMKGTKNIEVRVAEHYVGKSIVLTIEVPSLNKIISLKHDCFPETCMEVASLMRGRFK